MKLTRILLEALLEEGKKRLLSNKFFTRANYSLSRDPETKDLINKSIKAETDKEREDSKEKLLKKVSQIYIDSIYFYFFEKYPSAEFKSNLEYLYNPAVVNSVNIKSKSPKKESIVGHIVFDLKTEGKKKAIYAVPEKTILLYNTPNKETPDILWNKGDTSNIFSASVKKYKDTIKKIGGKWNIKDFEKEEIEKTSGGPSRSQALFRPGVGASVEDKYKIKTQAALKEKDASGETIFDAIFTNTLQKYAVGVAGKKANDTEYMKERAEDIMRNISQTALEEGFISADNSEEDITSQLVGKPGDKHRGKDIGNDVQKIEVLLGSKGIIKMFIFMNVVNYKINVTKTEIAMNGMDVYG
jgi:hypothetical protein